MDVPTGSTREILKDAGFGKALMDRYIAESSEEEKSKLLEQHRKTLLEEIHAGQKKLDCLDYLIYQREKGRFL